MSADHLYSYQLGAMTLTIISEGTVQVPAEIAFQGIDEEQWRPLVQTNAAGYLTYDMNIVHVAVENHSILLDTGIGESPPLRTTTTPSFSLTQTANLLSCLASIGVQPDHITAVIFSHTHFDHIMGATVEQDGRRIPTFPRARYFLMKKEWTDAPGRSQPDSPFHLHLPLLQEQGLLHLVEGEYEVAPGVWMIPAPGETPGHAIVKMESQGKTAFYLGDLFHHPLEVSHRDWILHNREKVSMFASRARLIREVLATDALLITAHMPFPGMGKIQRCQDRLEWVATL